MGGRPSISHFLTVALFLVPGAWTFLPGQPLHERLQVFTDRSLYIAGETVQFRADQVMESPNPAMWSTVLYAELVNSEGRSLAKSKHSLQFGYGSGILAIPPTLLTGNYFLKCYTRWMRNTGPEIYSYVPLKIINPDRIEVEGGSLRDEDGPAIPVQEYIQGILSCSINKTRMGQGETFELEISRPSGLDGDSLHCCVTIAEIHAIHLSGRQLLTHASLKVPSASHPEFLPDLGKGSILSGRVSQRDGKPAPDATLFFSMLGEKPDLLVATTDPDGRYEVITPLRYGMQEMFTDCLFSGLSDVRVTIDSDFDPTLFHLPEKKFRLTESERETASRLFLNTQFSKAYAFPDRYDTLVPVPPAPFYGTRVNSLIISDYVALPTIEEMIINLVPAVSIVRQKGKPVMKIVNENFIIDDYAPLVLMDNIVIFDHEAVLALPPEKIDRIDVLDEIYIKGGVLFGGVVALYSRNGDLAGIDLPPGSAFFDYLTFQPEGLGGPMVPDSLSRVPDSRNTILWVNDLILKGSDPVTRSVSGPSFPGEYVALIRALSPDGGVLVGHTRFSVE